MRREDEGGGLEAESKGEKERQQDTAGEGAACGRLGGNHHGRVGTRYATCTEGGREVDHVYGGRREVDHVYSGREGGRWIIYTVGGREVDHVYGGRGVEASRRYVMGRKSQIARCTSRRGKRPVGGTSWEGRAR